VEEEVEVEEEGSARGFTEEPAAEDPRASKKPIDAPAENGPPPPQRRGHVSDPTIDVVIVFKEHRVDGRIENGRALLNAEGDAIYSFDTIVAAIHKAGLYTVSVRSKRKWSKKKGLGYVYLGVGATEQRLIIAADESKHLLPCNPTEVRRMAETGRPGIWAPPYSHVLHAHDNDSDSDGGHDNDNDDGHGHPWERALIPRDLEDPKFTAGQEAFYSSMQTENLSCMSLIGGGCRAMVTHPQRPYEGLYLPFETYSIMQKPNADNAVRVEKRVHLVTPPQTLEQMKAGGDPALEFHYDLYARHPCKDPAGQPSIFANIDRQRLVMDILTAPPDVTPRGITEGCGFDLEKLTRKRIIKDAFVLHDEAERQELLEHWSLGRVRRRLCGCCKRCKKKNGDDDDTKAAAEYEDHHLSHLYVDTSKDMSLVREYFGEQTAMYFGFVSFLIESTWPIAVLGAGLLIWQIVFFFQEIERRAIAGFWFFAHNGTAHYAETLSFDYWPYSASSQTALAYLRQSCASVREGSVVISTAAKAYSATTGTACPSQFFRLRYALEAYNATLNVNNTNPVLREDVTAANLAGLCTSFIGNFSFNSTAFLPFLAITIIAWCVMVGVFWKRRQTTYACEWGTSGCETSENIRQSFIHSKDTVAVPDNITGARRIVAYPWRRLCSRLQTRSVILAMCLTVGAMCVAVVCLRIFLTQVQKDPVLRDWAGILCGIVNSVQIVIMTVVWRKFAFMLNDRENWKTDTEWEDALTLKTFLFMFVNNYSGCFYIVLLQSNVDISRDWLGSEDASDFVRGQCGNPDGGCLRVLGVNLIVIFSSKIIVGNAYEVFTIVSAHCKGKKAGGGANVDAAKEVEEEDDDDDDDEGAEAQEAEPVDVSKLHPMERDHMLPKCECRCFFVVALFCLALPRTCYVHVMSTRPPLTRESVPSFVSPHSSLVSFPPRQTRSKHASTTTSRSSCCLDLCPSLLSRFLPRAFYPFASSHGSWKLSLMRSSWPRDFASLCHAGRKTLACGKTC
jgi:hypothetical protein